MAVNPPSGRLNAFAGSSARAPIAVPQRGVAPSNEPAETGPVRARPIATATADPDVEGQIDRLERLLENGNMDRRARRGSYLNILI
ncbi:MAG: hypothetical protein FJX35_13860 [Alphaproteobacteria bacterium]|nr:hypothetical protein [Alphaproteobacteria bacterium]